MSGLGLAVAVGAGVVIGVLLTIGAGVAVVRVASRIDRHADQGAYRTDLAVAATLVVASVGIFLFLWRVLDVVGMP